MDAIPPLAAVGAELSQGFGTVGAALCVVKVVSAVPTTFESPWAPSCGCMWGLWGGTDGRRATVGRDCKLRGWLRTVGVQYLQYTCAAQVTRGTYGEETAVHVSGSAPWICWRFHVAAELLGGKLRKEAAARSSFIAHRKLTAVSARWTACGRTRTCGLYADRPRIIGLGPRPLFPNLNYVCNRIIRARLTHWFAYSTERWYCTVPYCIRRGGWYRPVAKKTSRRPLFSSLRPVPRPPPSSSSCQPTPSALPT